MKSDLTNRADIEKLVNAFYDKVLVDENIGHFFFHARNGDWPKHLATMYDFWENAIFYTGGYFGNPILVHDKVHHHIPFEPKHFDRWLLLFRTTVDELFEGSNAEMTKQRAASIATVMQVKLFK